ncbi:MAG: hypothetical protein PWQ28_131 [Candidatus Woesearchaeota archaeon]|nr:hypothetical protein [Candidatus Woesearchaeota archaeon]
MIKNFKIWKEKKGVLALDEIVEIILVIMIGVAIVMLILNILDLTNNSEEIAAKQLFYRLKNAIIWLPNNDETKELIPLEEDYAIMMFSGTYDELRELQTSKREYYVFSGNPPKCNDKGCICLLKKDYTKEIDNAYSVVVCEGINNEFEEDYIFLPYKNMEMQLIEIKKKDNKVELNVYSKETEMMDDLEAGVEELNEELKKFTEEGGIKEIKLQDLFNIAKPRLLITNEGNFYIQLETATTAYQENLDLQDYEDVYFIGIGPAYQKGTLNNLKKDNDCIINNKRLCLKSIINLEHCEDNIIINVLDDGRGMGFEKGYLPCTLIQLSGSVSYPAEMMEFEQIYLKSFEASAGEINRNYLFVIATTEPVIEENLNELLNDEKILEVLLGNELPIEELINYFDKSEIILFKEEPDIMTY